jgi:hypothetical protein
MLPLERLSIAGWAACIDQVLDILDIAARA